MQLPGLTTMNNEKQEQGKAYKQWMSIYSGRSLKSFFFFFLDYFSRALLSSQKDICFFLKKGIFAKYVRKECVYKFKAKYVRIC